MRTAYTTATGDITYKIVTELGKIIFVRGHGNDPEEAHIDALTTSADELDSPAVQMVRVHPAEALRAWMMGGIFLDNEIEQIGGATV